MQFLDILKLIVIIIIPALLTAIFLFLQKKGIFDRMSPVLFQVITGICYGAIACLFTRIDTDSSSIVVITSDASILTAGYVFGAPAGLIAGAIGGVIRWLTVYQWAAIFSRIAISVSCLVSGVIPWLLRRYLLDNKRPFWGVGVYACFVIEITDINLLFFTNMNNIDETLIDMRSLSTPLIFCNALAVGLALIVMHISEGEPLYQHKTSEETDITHTILKWLFNAIFICFILAIFITNYVQYRASLVDASDVLTAETTDVIKDIEDGYGIGSVDIYQYADNRHIYSEGFVLITDDEYEVVSHTDSMDLIENGTLLDSAVINELSSNEPLTAFDVYVLGQKYICMYNVTEGYYAISFMQQDEAFYNLYIGMEVNTFMLTIIFTILFILIYILLRNKVVNNIHKINHALGHITEGELDTVVEVRDNQEFSCLSDDINATVDTLKRYIAEAASRIDQELEYARRIQQAALPIAEHECGSEDSFDLYADMHAAKEVGGDFYDFYMVDDYHLAVTVADVSGKGIPAAMFMMKSKAIVKSLMMRGVSVDRCLTEANKALCEGNDADMFVTLWLGLLDLRDGHMLFANAGHNPPLIRRSDGGYEYLKSRSGFILAGMEDYIYKEQSLELGPGDEIFLYTDGVTEATNSNNELFGDDRLQDSLNRHRDDGICLEELCRLIKSDVDSFVGEAPQFDDITMFSIRFNSFKKRHGTLIKDFNATLDELDNVIAFIESEMEKLEAPMKVVTQLDVAVEEIFVNIAHYAYEDGRGTATVELDGGDREVVIRFIDHGVKFDPLAKTDPDVTLSVEDREIGGLGIYMVKKTMDEVNYEYVDGSNILTIKKKW